MSSEFRDIIERFAEGLSPDEFAQFELMSPEEQKEAMYNAGVLRDDFNIGGRVDMQEGGEAEDEEEIEEAKSYEDLLADLDAAQAELSDGSVSVTQESPGIEALYRQYGPQLSNLLASPIDQEGMEGRFGSLLPGAAQQNQLQQAAEKN